MSILKPGEVELNWTEANDESPEEYSRNNATVVVKQDAPFPEEICWFSIDRENADQWAEFVATACNAFQPLLAACELALQYGEFESGIRKYGLGQSVEKVIRDAIAKAKRSLSHV